MNILTEETQCGFKSNKSTADVIFFIKQKFIKKEIYGQILFDLTKAFDKINREKLWIILYEAGLPLNFIKFIIKGHENNKLCCKFNGKLTNPIDNNVGVFQGNPMSPQLFAIYLQDTMKEYKQQNNKNNNTTSKLKTRTSKIEEERTDYLLKKQENNNLQWNKIGIKNFIVKNIDYLLFADDTNIELKNREETLNKLLAYEKSTTKYSLEINWKKVNILTTNTKEINTLGNNHYSNIKYVNKGKILGHLMTADSKMDQAVNDRLNKAKYAWILINKKIIFNKQLDSYLKIRLYKAFIASILYYGLQILPLNKNLTNKLQNFQAKCIRYIVNENYNYKEPNRKLKTNNEINNLYNIASVESTLKKQRYKLYIKWKKNISFAYLNNEEYIDNELKNITNFAGKIKNIATNNTKEDISDLFKYHILFIKSKDKKGLIEKLKQIDIETIYYSTNEKTLNLILDMIPEVHISNDNNEHGNNIYTCKECNKKFNSQRNLNIHIRENIYCNTLNEIRKHTLIKCRNEGCNTTWKNNAERDKHEKYHCHIDEEEKQYFTKNINENQLNRRKMRNSDYQTKTKHIIMEK